MQFQRYLRKPRRSEISLVLIPYTSTKELTIDLSSKRLFMMHLKTSSMYQTPLLYINSTLCTFKLAIELTNVPERHRCSCTPYIEAVLFQCCLSIRTVRYGTRRYGYHSSCTRVLLYVISTVHSSIQKTDSRLDSKSKLEHIILFFDSLGSTLNKAVSATSVYTKTGLSHT